MADTKCVLQYCGAKVVDYDYAVNVLKCPCLKCFGSKTSTCSILTESEKMHVDMLRLKCSKCKFYNGR